MRRLPSRVPGHNGALEAHHRAGGYGERGSGPALPSHLAPLHLRPPGSLAHSGGPISLLFSLTLLQAIGPGMLHLCADSILHDWWLSRRGAVSAAVQVRRPPHPTPARAPRRSGCAGPAPPARDRPEIGPEIGPEVDARDWPRGETRETACRMRARAQVASGALGMVLMPWLISLSSSCTACTAHECGCWRSAYSTLAALLALPVALVSALLLEGGATDHDLFLDDIPRSDATSAAAAIATAADGTQPAGAEGEQLVVGAGSGAHGGARDGDGAVDDAVDAATDAATDAAADAVATPLQSQAVTSRSSRTKRALRLKRAGRRRTYRDGPWALHDVLHHSTYWLAQLSISLVQAIVAAFLFHRCTPRRPSPLRRTCRRTPAR